VSNELLKLSWRAREVLGAEACFMRLGFHEDQVAIACQPVVLRGVISHDMAILVVLQVDDKAFVYVVDPVSPDEPRAKIKKELVDAKRAWNRATQDQRDEIYRTSEIMKASAGFVFSLMSKGIDPPFTRGD